MTSTEVRKPQYRVIGTRPIRHDGMDKVTGRAKYGADIHLPGLLTGRVLRSPHAHARIRGIDISKALALAGVEAVVTSADFPIHEDKVIDLAETLGNVRVLAENIMASEKVLYQGHALAAVAATSAAIADEALGLIDVDYEVLPPVLNGPDAMDPNSPRLHEAMTTFSVAKRFERGTDTGVGSNIASHLQFKFGDPEAGFAEADAIVEREYTTSTVHQGYIEPHTATALWDADGHVTVWSSSQGAFGMRAQTAAILGIPESRVKAIPMEIGGGFGGKLNTYLDPVAAALSRKTGKPVKITMDRAEVFIASGPTSATRLRVKIGAKKDGTLTAATSELVYEAGAFPGSPVGAGAATGFAPYKIENIQVDGYDVVVNKPKVAAYRAPGSPQAAYAIEQAMSELADKLGMDPMDLRLKNVIRPGDRLPTGVPLPPTGCEEMERAMKSHPHYNAPIEGPNRGRGVAVGFWGNAGNSSSATVSVTADGTVTLVTGSADIGGTRASLAMHAAEVLGIAAEDVKPSVGDTDSVGWTGQTGGSRTTFSTGIAVVAAAEKVRDEMVKRAAILLETEPGTIEFDAGTFRNGTGKTLTFKDVAAAQVRTGGSITESASSNPRQVGPAFAGHMVDVEVDPETGKVEVLRYTAFQDVGTAAHPSYVEGQIQGAVAQGVGWALNEEYVWDEDGGMENASFLDYRMPTTLDLPMIETVLIEEPNPAHPFGVRGVGEVCIVPPMAAIANAVANATGRRLTHLPMSPGRILEALEQPATNGNGR
jgi:CO/xanthine dehydrogenase Mo-binding subunit